MTFLAIVMLVDGLEEVGDASNAEGGVNEQDLIDSNKSGRNWSLCRG